MKRNDREDLKTKTIDELKRILRDLEDEIVKLKVDQSLKKLSTKGGSAPGGKNTNEIKNKKKYIARALTFLSMKMSAQILEDQKKEAQSERLG